MKTNGQMQALGQMQAIGQMQAVVYTEYGSADVLELKEVEKPVPKDNEVLVKVQAASINYIDWQVLTGESFFIRLTTLGLRKPRKKMLGDDFAGRIFQ